MHKPFMGPEREDWENYLCGHQRLPGEIICARDAAWHGYVLDESAQSIVAMMSCCDEHLPLMKLTADFTHPLQHPCCVPGAWFWWPENECRLEWDDAELLTQAAAEPVSV